MPARTSSPAPSTAQPTRADGAPDRPLPRGATKARGASSGSHPEPAAQPRRILDARATPHDQWAVTPDYAIGRLLGRFVVTWYDSAGRRRRFRLVADTLRKAQAEARDVVDREMRGRPGGPTVADLWAAYRGERQGRRIAAHMEQTGKSLLPAFGHFRADQITTADCRAYAAARRGVGRKPHTIHTELGHLRICLSWAQKMRMIAWAPPIERPAQPAPRDRHLTEAEIARLLDADCAPHIHLAIVLLLTTAGRVTAILDLTWDRVDFERGKVDLRLDAAGPRKGRAVVPMNATLRRALLAARNAATSPHVVEWGGRRVLSIKRGFASAVAAAGLRDVTPHVLRHTAAVQMVAAGVGMERIAQYLGHSSVQTTRSIYARFAPDHLREAAAVLDFGNAGAVRRTKASPRAAITH